MADPMRQNQFEQLSLTVNGRSVTVAACTTVAAALLAAGRPTRRGLRVIGSVGATAGGERDREQAGERGGAGDTHNNIRHSGASIVAS